VSSTPPEPAVPPSAPVEPVPEAARRAPSPPVAIAEVILASGFPTQLALGALLAAAGVAPFGADGGLSMGYVSLLMPADTILLAALIVWRLRAGGERVSAVLLGRRNWTRECWIGVGLIPLVFGGVAAVMLVLRAAWPALHNVGANPFESLIRSRTDALLLGVLVIVTGGLKEELQRAFVLHRFDQSLGGGRVGLVVYSVVFGTGHIIQGYDIAIVTTLLGLAWGIVYLRRRSLVAPAVSHAGFNAAQVLQFALLGA
jgi:membrane protease YdiL (CAAX protease family)